jgi:hypothetical protein
MRSSARRYTKRRWRMPTRRHINHHDWRLWWWTLCSRPLVYLMSHYGRGKTAAEQCITTAQ